MSRQAARPPRFTTAQIPHFVFDVAANCEYDATGAATHCDEAYTNARIVRDPVVFGDGLTLYNSANQVASAYRLDLASYADCLADGYSQ